MLALDDKNEAIGYRDVDREAWMKPGVFYVKIIVAPHARNQGLGTQMYESALRAARELGAAGGTFLHNGLPAQLRFSVQPQALRPFVRSVASPRLHKVSASFQMVGMNMGFNLYELRLDPAGRWTATVTLPVCSVSRMDWIAELNLDGRLYVLAFATR